MGTLYIFWLRQIKKYIRSKSRIVGSLAQPLLFLVALGFGFGPIFQQASGINYIEFLAPGIIAMSILFTALFTGLEVIWDRQFGFLKETLVAPISRLQIMVGKTLGGITVSVIQGLIVLLITLAVGFSPYNLLMLLVALIFMILIAGFFTALGTAIASKMTDMQGFQLIMNFLILPLFFLSGALFPLDGIPLALKITAYLDPLTYGVDGLRGALTGISHFNLWVDLLVMLALTIILLVLGSYLFSKIEI